MNINKTNCYMLLLTILFFTTLITCRTEINNVKNRCHELEEEIIAIKNEAESNDYQSYIQLHTSNK